MRRRGESILTFPDDTSKEMAVEELFCDGPIRIFVTETNHAQCKLAIDAPIVLAISRKDRKATT